MRSRPTDETELCYTPIVCDQPPSIDPATLRRAMKFGQKAKSQHPQKSFEDLEQELSTSWLLRRESADWEWVREAVRTGFEMDPDEL